MHWDSTNKFYNMIWFQLVWWGMIFYPQWTIYAGLVFLVIHFAGIKSDCLQELGYSLIVALLGLSVDTLLNYYGVINLHPGEVFQVFPPMWIGVLWMSFSCTLRFSLQKIVDNVFLSIPLGAVGGAGSYFAGARFGVLSFDGSDSQTAIILGGVWACLFALFSVLNSIVGKRRV